MTCWAIWKVRNDVVWKGKIPRVATVHHLATSMLEQWTRAQNKVETPTAAYLTKEDGVEKWRLPAEGVVKVNVDAALFSEIPAFIYACVARDSHGHVLEAITCCRQGVVSPEMAEAMGVREALSWIKRKNWNHVLIETDCLTVIQALRSRVKMDSYFGSVISECKSLWSALNLVDLLFVKRSANNVAHAIGRASCSVADRAFRSDDFSPAICDVILKDIC
ncbi:uncharacterized protein LOC133805913 [Humulus lupulus]|uniref:uncharacterized protein LOC133805913 n=1 Tax=Humulus lupulus TaxID=3486 RepID=UPI002B4067F8|nr:uncharacterized protein LOC133805913 [Humulus lupulus]